MRWVTLAMVTFVIASVGTTAAEFAGIAAAGELFGLPRLVTVPASCALVFYLVVAGTYRLVEKVFMAMTVVFFGYVATAFLTTPDWSPVLRAAVIPTVRLEPGFLFMAITLVGTTVTSYMQFFLQASVVRRASRNESFASRAATS